MSLEGNEITGYDQPGELLVKSPSVVLGYLNNDKANKETFQDGYMRTGDEAVFRKAPSGHEHVFIVDRIKELIKVKVRDNRCSFNCAYMYTNLNVGSSSRTRRTRSASPYPPCR